MLNVYTHGTVGAAYVIHVGLFTAKGNAL